MNIGPAMAGFLGLGRITLGALFGGVFGGADGNRRSARCSVSKTNLKVLVKRQEPKIRDEGLRWFSLSSGVRCSSCLNQTSRSRARHHDKFSIGRDRTDWAASAGIHPTRIAKIL